MKNIILISGKAESGKDTVADLIKELIPNRRTISMSYASYLKHICKEIYNWNGIKDKEGRTLLQRIGTDVIRSKVPDFWVRNVAQLIFVLQDEFDYITISDCRFSNEIEYMISQFGDKVITLRIERPNHKSYLNSEQLKHLSEVALDNYVFDYLIINDGTIDDLRNKVQKFIKFME